MKETGDGFGLTTQCEERGHYEFLNATPQTWHQPRPSHSALTLSTDVQASRLMSPNTLLSVRVTLLPRPLDSQAHLFTVPCVHTWALSLQCQKRESLILLKTAKQPPCVLDLRLPTFFAPKIIPSPLYCQPLHLYYLSPDGSLA